MGQRKRYLHHSSYYNGVGPVCDPQRLTRANKDWHRYWMDQYLACGALDLVHQILAAYPYLWAEYRNRVRQAEEEARRGDDYVESDDPEAATV